MPTFPRARLAAALLAAAGALAACAAQTTVTDAAPADAAPPDAAPTAPSDSRPENGPDGGPALPDGWRWESYRDVQLAVPGDWTWIGGSQRTSQWCIEESTPTGIGRPGFATEALCIGDSEGGVSPGTRIARNGTFVAFDQAEWTKSGTVGDRTTVALGDVAVQVQAAPRLRDRILATLHHIDVDASGCAVRDEVTTNPSLAPSPAVALADLARVRSVASCLYDIDWYPDDPHEGPTLVASVRIQGAAAAAALAGLAAAPAAGGQDAASSCLYKYGSQMVVLLVDSAAGSSRVHVRFSGCDHNAVDDGASPRRLTPALRPFFSGPVLPDAFSGGFGKAEALFGLRPDGTVPPPTSPPS